MITLDLGRDRSFAGSVLAILDAVARAKESAHLSGIELSKRAGLSLRTIKTSKVVRFRPREIRCCGCWMWRNSDSLGKMYWTIQSPKIMSIQRRRPITTATFPPGYDSMRMVQQFVRMLNGPGGHIEQTNAYLEHRSALAYVSMCHDVELCNGVPAEVPAGTARSPDRDGKRTSRHSSSLHWVQAMDIWKSDLCKISFRCAHSRHELLLFDISQPLLTTAYQYAIDTFGEQSSVHTLLVHGTFTTSLSIHRSAIRQQRSTKAALYDARLYARQSRQRAGVFQHSLAHSQIQETCCSSTFSSATRPWAPASLRFDSKIPPSVPHPFPEPASGWNASGGALS